MEIYNLYTIITSMCIDTYIKLHTQWAGHTKEAYCPMYICMKIDNILACQGSLRLIKSVSAYGAAGKSLFKTPLLNSANEITDSECGRLPVMRYNFV